MMRRALCPRRAASSCGFTLVEVMVALGVFAFVAALALGALQAGLTARDQLGERAGLLADLQRLRAVLRADLAQPAMRPVRDEFGGTSPVSFAGGAGLSGEPILAFVRHGWANPGGLQARASLQHVSWLIEEDRLIRRTRPLLDPVPDTPVIDQVMIEGVRLRALAFYGGGRWQPRWLAGQPPDARLPQAVALTLEIAGIGDIRSLFLAAVP